MAVRGYKVEVFDSKPGNTRWGITRWGLKDLETGDWVELRGIYASSEIAAIEAHCKDLNDYPTAESNAERVGRRCGKNAAEWALEPDRLSKEQMNRILDAMEQDDQRILGQFRIPDLSGESQGSYTPASLAEELDIDPDDDALMASVCEAWELGAGDAFWAKIHETLLLHTQES